MVKCMSSPSRRHKIFCATLFTLLLLFLFNSSYATAHERTYKLLDSPDGSINYRLRVSVTEALYANYSSKDHTLYYSDFSRFVTPDALEPIAEDLRSIYNNDEDFANGVLMLVHQIPYVESDPQKYPVETIVENEGDCDLLSIVAASIMKAGGLDVVLLHLELHDHMLLGVNLPESPKDARSKIWLYSYEGKKYYVAETTGGNWEKGWRVGECPEVLLPTAAAKIIALENYEETAPGQVSSSYIIPDSSALRMSLSTNFVVAENDVEISGSLSPSLAGESITLYISSMGSPSTLLTTVVTDSNGEYSHTWQAPPGGIYSIRATWGGDEDYTGAASSTFRLIVIPSDLLMIVIILSFLLVILLVVNLATRGSTWNEPETPEDWEFADNPENF
jgi:hypothetical protein